MTGKRWRARDSTIKPYTAAAASMITVAEGIAPLTSGVTRSPTRI
jgi:hypothetical protein